MNEYRLRISDCYHKALFEDERVDKITGNTKIDLTRKFATYPHIGSNYGNGPKILFVGYDIGMDETPGKIQNFEERRSIETYNLRDKTIHIAGTYFTSLYFLKKFLKLEDFWEEIKSNKYGGNFKSILNNIPEIPKENPLSYVVLTNFYKYVTINRGQKDPSNHQIKTRRGNFDRVHLDRDAEIKLFLNEIDIFDPDIIFFQGKDFSRILPQQVKEYIKQKKIDAFYGIHPSKHAFTPENYINNYVFSLDK